ncbi:hypothetical protein ACM66B_000844 [Microbotryomycetes sp. NB124-2]
MKRRNVRPNAPDKVPMPADDDRRLSPPPPSSHTTAHAKASGSKHMSVPLFGRKVSTKDGELDLHVDLDPDTGKATVRGDPSTPWHELDLSDSFLAALHTGQFEPKKPLYSKRRFFLLLGSLLGIALSWFMTEGDPLKSLADLDLDALTRIDLQNLVADLPNQFNFSEMLAPGREWLSSKSSSFVVGREAAEKGMSKKHAVVIVPGIISSGLESWSTAPDAAQFFRKRIWAGVPMIRAILTAKDAWVKTLSLDEYTGLDPDGYKVRSAQGLDAATAFVPGYWIWQKVIENLSVLDYDYNDMHLFSYDWRLAFYNLEVRDKYFSRLKAQIEFNKHVLGKKTALLSHSMGSVVVLWFFKWVENPEYGRGGNDWVETHVADWVNIAGTLFGVPKAMAALLSGEMRDTVEINAAGVYLLEKFFSRQERAKLFRSWAGSSSMLLKGGNDVWGDHDGAPDDPPNANLTAGKLYYFKPEIYGNETDINSVTANPNLTLAEATGYILNHVPPAYQAMLHANFSLGFERDPQKIAQNDNDHRKWANPLETRLPNAPSMSIYCLYGVGKETERGYFYQQGGFEHDETVSGLNATCEDPECTDQTPRTPLDLPLSRRVWIDGSVTLPDSHQPKVRSGVVFNDGDGTVSMLSLGAMCQEGWKRDLYNPGRSRVVTHEINHEPQSGDLRGGTTTSDHVDILGNSELQRAIIDVVTGNGHLVEDQYHSRIREAAAKIKWEK